jgi:AraC-like DNA-binding protein
MEQTAMNQIEIEIKLFTQPLDDLVARLTYYRRLEKAWQLIEANYADTSLTLERAAKECGANKNHLNTLFRQTSGFTFHQFLIRYRLLNAIIMMKAKNYSLLEIAVQTGFGSLSTFERNFRRIFDMTPREFKSNLDLWQTNPDLW